MQSTSCKMLGWIKHKMKSRLPGEISITSDDTIPMAEREEELNSLLMKVKKDSEKETKKLRQALLRPLRHSRKRKQGTGSLAAPRGRWVGWLFICGESEGRSRVWVRGVSLVFSPPFAGIECRVDTQSPGFALNTMFLLLAL